MLNNDGGMIVLVAFSDRLFLYRLTRRCSPGYNVGRLWRQ
jgi:hypothetical protein